MPASRFLVAFALAALTGAVLAAAPVQSQKTLQYRGTTSMSSAQPSAPLDVGLEIRTGLEADAVFERLAKGSNSPARVPAAGVPKPADTPWAGLVANVGFDGLTVRDQRLASNGNQFTSEPPDQGLAVGNGYIVEAVNTAIRVRDTRGGTVVGTVGLNEFFKLAPSIDRGASPPTFGPFTSDPKAYYDRDTDRWFVTLLEIDTDPASGDFLPRSSVLIAVSATASPAGTWNLYSIDTTNATGTPEHAGCPCFGDQPLIGADAHGFYISTNEFPIFVAGFNGAQVYALSKTRLAAGTLGPVVAFSGLPLAEGPAYTLQPAITAQGAAHELGRGGTEYFLSALDFNGTLDNRIAVWALTNTQSLAGATPALTLSSAVLASQVYGQPPSATQRPGPTPLGDLIKSGAFGQAGAQKLPLIDANDDRMQQVTWAGGALWSSLNTVVKPENGTVRSGAAYFVVAPAWSAVAALGGSIVKQGVVSTSDHSLLFPSVGVNRFGKGVMSFSIVGDSVYPSVGYVRLDAAGSGTGPIEIAALGAAPDDGFSGYPAFGGRVGRWGDYSAAVADFDGAIWFANEYIPNLPRVTLANWGTFIGRVVP